MSLESALCEEDEYQRLQKLSNGIKQISNELLYQKNITQVSVIKNLLIAYPFQQASVELIITGIIDHFQNEQIIYTFFQALMELAKIQEIHIKKHRKSKLFDGYKQQFSIILRFSFKKLQKLEINLKYCKQVHENIIQAKQFSCGYIKILFEKAINLEQDIQYFARIFQLFIENTDDIQFQHFIVKIYEECKSELFINQKWTDDIDDCIIDFFDKNQIPLPFVKNKIEQSISPIKQQNNSLSNSLNESMSFDDQDKIDQLIQEKFNNIQKWLCIQEIPQIKQRIEYLTDDEYFEYIMTFIFYPTKHDTIENWKQLILNYNIIQEENLKFGYKKLTKEEIIRSYKTTQLIIYDNNFTLLFKTTPTFISNILYRIKQSLEDKNRNVNLMHIFTILEKLLLKYPKNTITFMVELKLFQIIGQYIYNNKLQNILSEILDIKIDRYKIGLQFQDYLWKYLQKCQYFESLIYLIKNKYSQFIILNDNENMKFISIFKSFIINEKEQNHLPIDLDQKKLLTDMLGILSPGKSLEEYYNSNQLNWQLNQDISENLLFSQIEQQDIDGFKKFINERDSNLQKSIHRIRSSIMIKSYKPYQLQKKQSNLNIQFIQLDKSFVHITGRHRKFCQSVNLQADSINENSQDQESKYINGSARSHDGTRTHRSEFGTQSDIRLTNSHRNIKIYPNFRISKFQGEFEITLKNFTINQNNSLLIIELIKQQIQSFYSFLSNNNKFNENQKIDLKPLINTILSSQTITILFQCFFCGMNSNTELDNYLGIECGLLLHNIYKYAHLYNEFEDVRIYLEKEFINIGEYLCKLIIQHYDYHQDCDYVSQTEILYLIIFQQGYQLCSLYSIETQKSHVDKLLDSTVLNILIYWFFQSKNNNIYQIAFLKLIINIFVYAPMVVLSSILFRLGFVGLLYDAYNSYYPNGDENVMQSDSLLTSIKCIVYAINATLIQRQLSYIIRNLNCLDSWKKLITSIPISVLSIFKEINFTINQNFNFKHKTINLIQTQGSIENINSGTNTPTKQISRFKPIDESHRIKTGYNFVKTTLPKLKQNSTIYKNK